MGWGVGCGVGGLMVVVVVVGGGLGRGGVVSKLGVDVVCVGGDTFPALSLAPLC